MQYEDFRREYTAGGLTGQQLDACPMAQFELWMAQAVHAQLTDPTAMVLATVDAQGVPWQRIVLCKGFDAGGFVFYTNHYSNKGRAISAHPLVSLLFPWNALDRQVIVSGVAEKMPQKAAEAYFATRPRASQIAAWASRQSMPIADRPALELQAQDIEQRFGAGDIPLPEFWGGYRVAPQKMEFWQGGENRLHDRFRYTSNAANGWDIEQLQP